MGVLNSYEPDYVIAPVDKSILAHSKIGVTSDSRRTRQKATLLLIFIVSPHEQKGIATILLIRRVL